jgi:DNA-directed RNA polymerase subunit RPC12/RpoP
MITYEIRCSECGKYFTTANRKQIICFKCQKLLHRPAPPAPPPRDITEGVEPDHKPVPLWAYIVRLAMLAGWGLWLWEVTGK